MADTLSQILALLPDLSSLGVKPTVVPATATPFSAFNATPVAAAATPQTVRAAVASKKKWITQAYAINPTTAEDAFVVIQDEDDTALGLLLAHNSTDAIAQAPPALVTFDPPIEVPAGKALEAACIGDIGDSYLFVNGYEEA